MKKRLISIILAAVMLVSVIPLYAFADNPSIEFSFDKENYTVGDDVFLTINAQNFADGGWIGVYCQNDPTDSSVKSIGWYNISDGNNKAVNITKDTSIMEWNQERSAYYYFPAKTYKVVAFLDGGYTPVDSAEFTISSPDGEPSFNLSVNKEEFVADDAIIITASGENYSPDAWVGVYLQSDTYGANVGVESIIWYNLRDANGVGVNIRTSNIITRQSTRTAYHSFPAGNYIAYIFEDGGYSAVDSVTFSIAGKPGEDIVEPITEPFVKTDKTTYKLGEAINVCAGNGSWVGVYEKGETPAPDLSRAWYYIYQANQIDVDVVSSALVKDQGTHSYYPGEFVVYLFGDDGYSDILAETYFTIDGRLDVDPSEFALETDKDTYSAGEAIIVTAADNREQNTGSWVGLYKSDDEPGTTSSYYWYYVADHNGAPVNILTATLGKNEEIEPGEYCVILFANSGYALPVSSLTKTISIVKEIISETILTNATCTNSGLKKVDYADGTSSIVTIPALGGEHVCNEDGFDIVKEPTCTKPGLQEGTCSICNARFTQEIPIAEHAFTGPFFGNGNATHSRICARCEASETALCRFGSDDYISGSNIYRTCSECDATTIYSFSLKSQSQNAVNIAYKNTTHESSYQMQLYDANNKKVGELKSGKSASVSFTGLTAGTYYKVLIRVVQSNGSVNSYSPWVTIVCPTLPKGTSISKLTAATKKVIVQYAKGSSVTGYQIEYSKKSDFTSSKILTIKKATTLKAVISSLSHNTKYYFRIRTYKTIASKNYFSIWSKAVSVTVKPVVNAAKIASLKAGKQAFTLKRSSVSGINGFQIQYATNAKFSKAKLVSVKNAKDLKKSVSKLKAKTYYYVRIRTYKTVSKVNYYSSWSATSKIKTK